VIGQPLPLASRTPIFQVRPIRDAQTKGLAQMSDFNRGYARTVPADRADMSVDAGLRSFMLGIYNKVALGLVLSAALAYLTGQFPPVRDLLYVQTARGWGMTMLGMIVAFAPLGVILFGMFALRNATPRSSGIYYWTIVALIGAGLGGLTLVYTGQSIASTFLISVVGVFIFAGLIAFDTQRLKMTYYDLGGDQASMGVATNFGALSLYINFINLFQFLLQLFGQRR